MRAWYNEIDRYCCDWLSNLMDAGEITPGVIDDRSIVDVSPDDVRGYERVHWFAGVAGWDIALDLAGWGDRPVWTGSCPCQPFSAAGQGKASDDERHLWPAWFRLIRECRPPIVFGEQVAAALVLGKSAEAGAPAPVCNGASAAEPSLSACAQGEGTCGEEGFGLRSNGVDRRVAGEDRSRVLRSDGAAIQLGWRSDMGQSVAGSDRFEGTLPLFEHAGGLPRSQQRDGRLGRAAPRPISVGDLGEEAGEVERIIEAIAEKFGAEPGGPWLALVQSDLERAGYSVGAAVLPACGVGAPHRRDRVWFVADAERGGAERRDADQEGSADARPRGAGELLLAARPGSADGLVVDAEGEQAGLPRRARQPRSTHWSDLVWLPCSDGKARPTQSTLLRMAPSVSDSLGFVRAGEGYILSPLVVGAKARAARLRGYGNSINVEVARAFIEAFLGCLPIQENGQAQVSEWNRAEDG